MECLDCGNVNEVPEAELIKLGKIFDGHIDVDTSAQEHLQLACPDCGAVLGYAGSGAASGSSNVRGFY